MQIRDKGQVTELDEGQAAQMVRYLAVRASRVNRVRKGSLTFHFAGPSVQVELKEKEAVGDVIRSRRK